MSVANTEVSGVKIPDIAKVKLESIQVLEVIGRTSKKSCEVKQLTVLKLTQVGEMRILRRSGERWLRNSAKWPRKFAIRGASDGSRCWRPQKIGSNDCLSKTQDSANTQVDV